MKSRVRGLIEMLAHGRLKGGQEMKKLKDDFLFKAICNSRMHLPLFGYQAIFLLRFVRIMKAKGQSSSFFRHSSYLVLANHRACYFSRDLKKLDKPRNRVTICTNSKRHLHFPNF